MRVIMICKRKTAQAANSASNSPFSLSAAVTLKAPRNTVFPAYVENKVLQLYCCKEAPLGGSDPAALVADAGRRSPSRC